jgi:hypothetical protein
MRNAALLFLLALALDAPIAQAACPPAGWDAARLAELKASKFVLADARTRPTCARPA